MCATDYCIYLLDPATGQGVGQLLGHDAYPWALAFTADSRMLYSAGWDGPVRRWDVPARKQAPLTGIVHATGAVAASPDGTVLAFGDDSGAVRLVDAQDGASRRMLGLAGTLYSQLAFSPDSRCLVGGGTSGENVHVALWEVGSGRLLHRWDWPKGRDPHSKVEDLAFTPDGHRLAAAVFRQSAVYLWDLKTDQQIAKASHSQVYGLSFSPDGATLATAGWDSTIRFWDAETGAKREEYRVEQQAANAGGREGDLRMYTVRFAPAGGLLATAHLDGQVRVWQASDMTLVQQFNIGGRFIYGAMSFSPDGLRLATGASSGEISVWDPLKAQAVWSAGRHKGYAYAVCFGRDSHTLLSGGDDGVGYLWDVRQDAPP